MPVEYLQPCLRAVSYLTRFNDTLKIGTPVDALKHPLKKMDNASDYMMLTIMQRMITDVQRKAVDKWVWIINQTKELYDVYVGSLDMYYRTSAVMIKTLKDSWQLDELSDKEIQHLSQRNPLACLCMITKLLEFAH